MPKLHVLQKASEKFGGILKHFSSTNDVCFNQKKNPLLWCYISKTYIICSLSTLNVNKHFTSDNKKVN